VDKLTANTAGKNEGRGVMDDGGTKRDVSGLARDERMRHH
jgi:hypothetical protein